MNTAGASRRAPGPRHSPSGSRGRQLRCCYTACSVLRVRLHVHVLVRAAAPTCAAVRVLRLRLAYDRPGPLAVRVCLLAQYGSIDTAVAAVQLNEPVSICTSVFKLNVGYSCSLSVQEEGRPMATRIARYSSLTMGTPKKVKVVLFQCGGISGDTSPLLLKYIK